MDLQSERDAQPRADESGIYSCHLPHLHDLSGASLVTRMNTKLDRAIAAGHFDALLLPLLPLSYLPISSAVPGGFALLTSIFDNEKAYFQPDMLAR